MLYSVSWLASSQSPPRPWEVSGVSISHRAGSETPLFIYLMFLLSTGVQPINSVVIVSGGQLRDSAIHKHVSVLPQPPLPPRPPRNSEQSSLCCTAGPCWPSNLNTAVRTRPSLAPYPFPLATIVCSLRNSLI